ncbi:MAG: DUF2442 domain-containing protein [Burkholderiaceae bacterium]|nr:DUF2442 domain-containing protein [Burkholderiaceae bacterium]
MVEARHVRDYVVFVKFSDDVAGEIDLAGELTGAVFEPLKDLNVFRQLRLDPDLRTIVWPNGADLAPEFVRARVQVDA